MELPKSANSKANPPLKPGFKHWCFIFKQEHLKNSLKEKEPSLPPPLSPSSESGILHMSPTQPPPGILPKVRNYKAYYYQLRMVFRMVNTMDGGWNRNQIMKIVAILLKKMRRIILMTQKSISESSTWLKTLISLFPSNSARWTGYLWGRKQT